MSTQPTSERVLHYHIGSITIHPLEDDCIIQRQEYKD